MALRTFHPFGQLGAANDAAEGTDDFSYDDAPPEALSKDNWVSWILNNAVPQNVVDYLAGKVITAEASLASANVALSKLRDMNAASLLDIDGINGLPTLIQQRTTVFADINTWKFWFMLVPQVRTALQGRVKPVDLSVLRANSDISSFIASYSFIVQPIADAGLATGLSGGALGIIPLTPAIVMAAIIASGVIALALVVKSADTIEVLSNNHMQRNVVAAIQAGKLPADALDKTQQAQIAAKKAQNAGSPFEALKAVAIMGGLAVMVYFGAPIVKSLVDRKLRPA